MSKKDKTLKDILDFILYENPSTQDEIAEKLGITRRYVTQLLQPLVKDGTVKRAYIIDLKSYENLNGSRKLELHLLRLQSRVFCLLFTAAKKIVEMVNHKPVSTTNETMTITSNTF